MLLLLLFSLLLGISFATGTIHYSHVHHEMTGVDKLSASGNEVMISNPGFAFIFHKDDDEEEPAGFGKPLTDFGRVIDLGNDVAVVGASNVDGKNVFYQYYREAGNNWVEKTYKAIVDYTDGGELLLSTDGSHVIAYGKDGSDEAFKLFSVDYNGTMKSEAFAFTTELTVENIVVSYGKVAILCAGAKKFIYIIDIATGDETVIEGDANFGKSMDFYGNYLLVGSNGEAFLYKYESGDWNVIEVFDVQEAEDLLVGYGDDHLFLESNQYLHVYKGADSNWIIVEKIPQGDFDFTKRSKTISSNVIITIDTQPENGISIFTFCSNFECANGATPNNQCTFCECENNWIGTLCNFCPSCGIGKVREANCGACTCDLTCSLPNEKLINTNGTCECACEENWTTETNHCDRCVRSDPKVKFVVDPENAANCICNMTAGDCVHGQFDEETCTCACDPNWGDGDYLYCDKCQKNATIDCHGKGILNSECECVCDGNFTGGDCNSCNNFFSGPNCGECTETTTHGTVNITECTFECDDKWDPANKCNSCLSSWKGDSDCKTCSKDCGPHGTPNENCECVCDTNFITNGTSPCALCPACKNGGTRDLDVCDACSCINANWDIGTNCEKCNLECYSGIADPTCTKCVCPSNGHFKEGCQECANNNWLLSSDCTECNLYCGRNGHANEECTSCICDNEHWDPSSNCQSGKGNWMCEEFSGVCACTQICPANSYPNEDCTGCDCEDHFVNDQAICDGSEINWDCNSTTGICQCDLNCGMHGKPNVACDACICDANWEDGSGKCDQCKTNWGNATLCDTCEIDCSSDANSKAAEDCQSCVCKKNFVFDTTCQCKAPFTLNDTVCECNVECNGGIRNEETCTCTGCPAGSHLDISQNCAPNTCLPGYSWDNSTLLCVRNCALDCGNGSPNDQCTDCICEGKWKTNSTGPNKCDICNGGWKDHPTNPALKCSECALCKNGGTPNEDCTSCIECTGNYTESTNCEICGLICWGGVPNADCTACTCTNHYTVETGCEECGLNCNHGKANNDCSECICDAKYTKASDCKQCGLTCLNSGEADDECEKCECKETVDLDNKHHLFSGDLCQNETVFWRCGGIRNDDIFVCGGIGDCTAPEKCECPDGLYGSNCEKYMCYGKEEEDLAVCGGNGDCIGIDTCDCDFGYEIYENCTMYKCGLNNFDASDVCNNHGDCVGPNDCQCRDGYTGANCDEFSCGGIDKDTPAACGDGTGTCVAPNTCDCEEGYTGFNCQFWTCDGLDKDDPEVCGGGECTGPNTCDCSALGFVAINDTCIHTCDGKEPSEVTVCGGKGICTGLDTCVCPPGFSPSSNCVSCYPDLSGAFCNETTCEASSTCNDHGTCNPNDACECTGNYDGKFCDQCKPGFFTSDCSVECDASVKCSGNGKCTENGLCECFDSDKDGKFKNADCSECQDGFFGKNCNIERISTPFWEYLANGVGITINEIKYIGLKNRILDIEKVFHANTTQLINKNSYVEINDEGKIEIYFMEEPMIVDEDLIVDFAYIDSIADGRKEYNKTFTNVELTGVYLPPTPTASISSIFTTTIGSCDDLVLDASDSTGDRITKFMFGIKDNSEGDIPKIRELFANHNPFVPIITIPSSLLRESTKNHIFFVTVENAFGRRDNSTDFFIRKKGTSDPIVYVDGPEDNVKLYDKFALTGRLELCGKPLTTEQEAEYKFSWEGMGADPEEKNNGKKAVFKEYSFTYGNTFTWNFVAERKTSGIKFKGSIDVTVETSDLVANIGGAFSRTVGLNDQIVVDGSSSFDRDNTNEREEFIWTCKAIPDSTQLSTFYSCNSKIATLWNATTRANKKLIIPPNTFKAEGMYEIELTYLKGNRDSITSVYLDYVAGEPPVVFINVKTEPEMGMDKIYLNSNGNEDWLTSDLEYDSYDVVLTGTVNGGTTETMEWTLADGGDITPFLKDGQTINDPTITLVYPSEEKIETNPEAFMYNELVITLKSTVNGIEGQTTITIPINKVPKGGDCSVSVSEINAFTTKFTISANNWRSDNELEYAFFYDFEVNGDGFIRYYQKENSVETILPFDIQTEKNIYVYCRIRDDKFGEVVRRQQITVKPFESMIKDEFTVEFNSILDAGAAKMQLEDCISGVKKAGVFLENANVNPALTKDEITELNNILGEANSDCFDDNDDGEVTKEILGDAIRSTVSFVKNINSGDSGVKGSVDKQTQLLDKLLDNSADLFSDSAVQNTMDAFGGVFGVMNEGLNDEDKKQKRAEVDKVQKKLTKVLVTKVTEGQTQEFGSSEITITVGRFKKNELQGKKVQKGQVDLTVPDLSDLVSGDNAGIVSQFYENNPFAASTVVSKVFGFDLVDENGDAIALNGLNNNLTFTFTLGAADYSQYDLFDANKKEDGYVPQCQYYDKTDEEWSSEGCSTTFTISQSGVDVDCSCNHATEFAIGMMERTYEAPTTDTPLNYTLIIIIVSASVAAVVAVVLLVVIGVLGYVLVSKNKQKNKITPSADQELKEHK